MDLPRLRQNILALGTMQAANYLIPLVTLPYLTRVLGLVAYGQLVFVQAVMAFLMLVVDFGFSWSATRHIAAHRTDFNEVSRTFSATWTAQWILVVVGGAGLAMALLFVPSLHGRGTLYASGFGLVVGQALFPVWLLQGLEKMKSVAVLQMTSKLLTLPLLFLVVRGPGDLLNAIAFFSSVSLFCGALAMGWVARQRLVRWRAPIRSEVRRAFQAGGVLFISKLAISLYTMLVPLVVGTVAGTTELGFFSLADRIKTAIQALLTPVSQALFPRMSLLFETDSLAADRLLKKTAIATAVISGAAGVFVMFFSEPIVRLLGGSEFSSATEVLRWLAFAPLVICFSNVLGVQVMLPKGMHKPFSLILSSASLICVLAVYPMVRMSGAAGAAQLILIVEIVVAICMAVYVRRRSIARAC